MKKKFISALTGLFSGVCNGLFGSGGGTLAVPVMEKFGKIEAHKAHATAIAFILPLSLISGIIYFYGIEIPVKETLFACLGGLVGGFAGAKMLGKIKGRTLHIIFGVFMLLGGMRMLFGRG